MRFVPPELEPYLQAVEGGDADGGLASGPSRHAAVRALIREYASGRRVLIGVGLWLAVVLGTVAVLLGVIMIFTAVFDSYGPLPAIGGAAVVAAGVALSAWGAVRGRQLLRAGARISQAAERWMRPVRVPSATFGNRLYALLSPLVPQIYPRLILSSFVALGAVLLACVPFLVFADLPSDGPDAALGVLLAVVSAVLAIACAVPAVALWRGTSRIQRVLIKDSTVV